MTSTSTTDYWTPSQRSTIPFSREMAERLKKDISRNVFQESPITSLLRKQVTNAEKAMARELESNLLWGGIKGPTEPKGLRQIIAEAYDEHMPKEAEVNAVDEVMKEREEARARELFEKVDEIFGTYGFEVGSVIAWNVVFEVGGKECNYAAVLSGDGCWYVTGRDTDGRKTEAFKGYLVELAMQAHMFKLQGREL